MKLLDLVNILASGHLIGGVDKKIIGRVEHNLEIISTEFEFLELTIEVFEEVSFLDSLVVTAGCCVFLILLLTSCISEYNLGEIAITDC